MEKDVVKENIVTRMETNSKDSGKMMKNSMGSTGSEKETVSKASSNSTKLATDSWSTRMDSLTKDSS